MGDRRPVGKFFVRKWVRTNRVKPRPWMLMFIIYIYILGGGFKYFLFLPLLGEMIQFDEYFSKGLKPPTSIHGGPTGMVVANMAVHGPFFQPANVEGTGSHHSWL